MILLMLVGFAIMGIFLWISLTIFDNDSAAFIVGFNLIANMICLFALIIGFAKKF